MSRYVLDKSKGFTNIPIIEIARFSPKLQHLSLNSCQCLTDRCITEIARSCPKLKHLELGNCSISNKAVEEIASNCTNLEYLSLEGCKGISEEVMKKLNPKIKIEYPSFLSSSKEDIRMSLASREGGMKQILFLHSVIVSERLAGLFLIIHHGLQIILFSSGEWVIRRLPTSG